MAALGDSTSTRSPRSTSTCTSSPTATATCALDDELLDASAAYFTVEREPHADRRRHRRALPGPPASPPSCSPSTPTTATGHPALSSEEIADEAAAHADVLIPFGSVDPHQGAAAVRRARAAGRATTGSAGSSSTPACRRSRPNDPALLPALRRRCEELGVPALFHTGQTGIGAGLPGGRGIKLRYSDPMLLDDVAADFPDLTIILAHPSVPWQDEAISMATHKANVYIDLSGWSPKYFPPQLVRAAGGLLKHKVLFGSRLPADHPGPLAGATSTRSTSSPRCAR